MTVRAATRSDDSRQSQRAADQERRAAQEVTSVTKRAAMTHGISRAQRGERTRSAEQHER